MIFGLTAALCGEITIKDGAPVEQSNFHNYRMVRMAETPKIETTCAHRRAALGRHRRAGRGPHRAGGLQRGVRRHRQTGAQAAAVDGRPD